MYSGAFTWLLRWVRPAIKSPQLKDVLKIPILLDVTMCHLVSSSSHPIPKDHCGVMFRVQRITRSFHLDYTDSKDDDTRTPQNIMHYSCNE